MSNFTIKTEQNDNFFIVRSNGYLDEHGGAIVFSAVDKDLPAECTKVILNLKESPVINSQGIAQIIELSEIIVDDKSGEVAFVGLSDLTYGVFKMVGLLQMGNPYDSEAEAIAAMRD
ncbi:MAG: STAS domain-containing protein [Candidatus Riflebacteria bacterium]|nr:STAS domain-containing protein [Candidatus Riflebacteria bacterium]